MGRGGGYNLLIIDPKKLAKLGTIIDCDKFYCFKLFTKIHNWLRHSDVIWPILPLRCLFVCWLGFSKLHFTINKLWCIKNDKRSRSNRS